MMKGGTTGNRKLECLSFPVAKDVTEVEGSGQKEVNRKESVERIAKMQRCRDVNLALQSFQQIYLNDW